MRGLVINNKLSLFIITLLIVSLVQITQFDALSDHDNSIPFASTSTSTEILSIDNISKKSIAFVKPVFTSTAYSGFYDFFGDLSLNASEYLRLPLYQSWSTSQGAYEFLVDFNTTMSHKFLTYTITDLDVHMGDLITEEGFPRYDIAVFFHSEYVTSRMYDEVLNYLSIGGNIIVFNGNAFFAEVAYDEDNDELVLISGHGFEFDGVNGTSSPSYYRFWNSVDSYENARYLGSRYCKTEPGISLIAEITSNMNTHPIIEDLLGRGISQFGEGYHTHEENCLLTPNYHQIANWKGPVSQANRGIKMYETFPMGSRSGSLIHLGIFGTQIYDNPNLMQVFLSTTNYLTTDVLTPWIKYPHHGGIYNEIDSLVFTSEFNYQAKIDGIVFDNVTSGFQLDYLSEGIHNISIDFLLGNETINRFVEFVIDRTDPIILFNGKTQFSKPSNFPANKIEVCVQDENPEFFRYRDLTTRYVGTQKGFYGYRPNTAFPCYNIREDFDTNRIFRFEAIDSALNSYITWMYVDWSTPQPYTREIQPVIESINNTNAIISFPKPDSNTSLYTEISEDYLRTWNRYPMNLTFPESDTVASRLLQTSDTIIYRTVVRHNDKTHYAFSQKVYDWKSMHVSLRSNVSKLQIKDSSMLFEINPSKMIPYNITIMTFDNLGQLITSHISQSQGAQLLGIGLPDYVGTYFHTVSIEYNNRSLTFSYSSNGRLVEIDHEDTNTSTITTWNTTTVENVNTTTLTRFDTIHRTVTTRTHFSLFIGILSSVVLFSLRYKQSRRNSD